MGTWILVGMMGSGKSSVGRALAAASGRQFLDTDQLVQRRVARPIKQFFAIYGEDAFRDLETKMLMELEPAEVVLATGGGIILRPDNWTEMRRLGTTIYLQCSTTTLCERLQITRERRPLLQSDDWQEKLDAIRSQRESIYQGADITISVDQLDIEQVVAKILLAVGVEQR